MDMTWFILLSLFILFLPSQTTISSVRAMHCLNGNFILSYPKFIVEACLMLFSNGLL